MDKATQPEAQATQSGPSAQAADTREFPPGSQVTKQQYDDHPGVSQQYDAAAAAVAATAGKHSENQTLLKIYLAFQEETKCVFRRCTPVHLPSRETVLMLL